VSRMARRSARWMGHQPGMVYAVTMTFNSPVTERDARAWLRTYLGVKRLKPGSSVWNDEIDDPAPDGLDLPFNEDEAYERAMDNRAFERMDFRDWVQHNRDMGKAEVG